MTEPNNRIEEVKKILNSFRLCRHPESHLEDFTRQICQLFPQPLDDKELREKIERIVMYGHGIKNLAFPDKVADEILALLQPKIEEARAKAIELYVEQVLPLVLESAVERERESE